MGGVKFALEDLSSSVERHGGFQIVNDSKLWAAVAKDIGFDSVKFGSAGSTLKRIFQQRILAKAISHAEATTFSPSTVDRSALAAKLLAKRKATEALASASMSQVIKSETSDEKGGITCPIQTGSGDSSCLISSEIDDQSSEQKSGVKNEYDTECAPSTKVDEDNKLGGVKMKKECDSKSKSKAVGDSATKSETESSKSAKDDTRAFRDNVGSKSSTNAPREGESAKRRNRRDADGMGQLDDMPDRKLSRDERKFRSILRQIELLEKKQRGTDGVSATSSGDASPRRPGSWDNEIELASLTRRRKDLLKEELREKERDRDRTQDREKKEKEKEKDREKERKDKEQELVSSGKKRPAPQSRDSGTPQPIELNMSASKKPKGPLKQTPAKAATKIPGRRSSRFSDDRLQGPLVVLREYRRAARKAFPCLPRISATSSLPAENSGSSSIMRSKKAHILSSVENEIDRDEQCPRKGTGMGALWESEVPSNLDPCRLNPHRKPKNKLIFPVMKRLLQKWTDEKIMTSADDSLSVGAQQPVAETTLSGQVNCALAGSDEPMDLDQDLEMDVDGTGSPSHSPAPGHACRDKTESARFLPLGQQEGLVFVADIVSASQERTEETKETNTEELQSEGKARDAGLQGHRPSADTAHSSSQNRRPNGQDRGSGGMSKSPFATYQRSSPPLSPVSSTGLPSRHGSPGDRGAAESCSRAAEISASHRRPSSHETSVASPRSRHSTWDQAPASDRGSIENREGTESRERRDRDRDRDRDSRTSSREAVLSHTSGRDTSLHRDRQRESSPVAQSLRRRQVSPPRALFTGELRERGLQLSEGGLSRESLRRERQGLSTPASSRTTERLGLSTSGSIVRDRDRLSSLTASVELANRQVERSGSKHWAADLGRAISPSRSQDRGERGLIMSERLGLERAGGLDRGGLGGGNNPSRERSLSPRSKEALREMQVARERRAKGWISDVRKSRAAFCLVAFEDLKILSSIFPV